jgi:hypothetical protein
MVIPQVTAGRGEESVAPPSRGLAWDVSLQLRCRPGDHSHGRRDEQAAAADHRSGAEDGPGGSVQQVAGPRAADGDDGERSVDPAAQGVAGEDPAGQGAWSSPRTDAPP